MHPQRSPTSAWSRAMTLLMAILIALPTLGASSSSPSTNSSSKDDAKPPSPEQLQQLVAPVALYPDALLAQILMASTYPLEIVEAARWLKANPGLDSKALEEAMQKQSWDPSVKSLTAFPQVLEMMNEKLTWTTQLGDAFLADQKGVMNTAQLLRQKAKSEGNLKSNDQQKVAVESKPTGSQKETIVITSANPQVVYVPVYNPTVIYGVWAYPAYPPYYWYPPGYVATRSAISFGVGVAVGAALWGGCNWGRSRVNININRYNSFNRTHITNVNWTHNSIHRRGVSYKNRDVRNRYGGNQTRNERARDSFRGRSNGGGEQFNSGQGNRLGSERSTGSRGSASNRSGNRSGDLGGGNRSFGGEGGMGHSNKSALSGMRSGRDTFRDSERGFQSRGRGGFGDMGGGFGGRRGGFGGRHRR